MLNDIKRTKALIIPYKQSIAGYDNFENLCLSVATELKTVRKEIIGLIATRIFELPNEKASDLMAWLRELGIKNDTQN